jgi:acyl-CoA hydrolase
MRSKRTPPSSTTCKSTRCFPCATGPYFHCERPNLRHVSWFLSPFLREPFHDGKCDLVPNSFSEVPHLMRTATKCSLLLAAASPPDEYGFFSLGANAEYVAALAGEMPVFLEANAQVPRTRGENHIHIRDVVGWCEADYPLIEVPAAEPTASDTTIAGLVAERIPDDATLQIGIGSVPEQVIKAQRDHRRLGIHTELLPEGFVDASESLGSSYWSSSGGQPDYARGALFAEEGQSFIVLHASNHDESISRIVCTLHPGGAVTTFKNVVDKVVTKYGVAELRGQPIRERTRRLIAIAHPKFRDGLEKDASEMGYL